MVWAHFCEISFDLMTKMNIIIFVIYYLILNTTSS